ncbi:hypothetical protein [Sinomonas atrocyanea]|nr:hypothetical protein [Sinomonas atrocyanea]
MDNPGTPEGTPFEQALQNALTEADAFGQPHFGPTDIGRPASDETDPQGAD